MARGVVIPGGRRHLPQSLNQVAEEDCGESTRRKFTALGATLPSTIGTAFRDAGRTAFNDYNASRTQGIGSQMPQPDCSHNIGIYY